ncbi:MAG: LuxR C-terminal-related transcriptional regulator, partial [Actinomycetota bacterium]|nr:LuxR C-terminal-related transcriptional regulator [Actinomycetota bacterium]
LTFTRRRGSDAPRMLFEAARRLEPLDAGLARETYVEAIGAAIFAGRLGDSRDVRKVAESARAAPSGPEPPRAIDLLLDGLARRVTDGYAAGVPPLRRALDAFAREEGRAQDELAWLLLASPVAHEVWDAEAADRLTARSVARARDAGALTVLPIALEYRAGVHFHSGRLAAASTLIEEANAISEATGNAPLVYASLVLAAWRGQEATTLELIEASIRDATARGEGRVISLVEYARAVLYNGLGRYEAALTAAQRACEHEDLGLFAWPLAELVEASARSGSPGVAAAAFGRLEQRTRAGGTDWALGIEAGSRALLSDGGDAEALYREALERLDSSRCAFHRARTQLLYGEWLRREGRRVDAREQLRVAHEMFGGFGAGGFAERARRELLATGETVRTRRDDATGELTPQELAIARLAAEGHTNPEIGAQLFLSARTVEWHLRKVFAKLGISSRRQLRAALPESSETVASV